MSNSAEQAFEEEYGPKPAEGDYIDRVGWALQRKAFLSGAAWAAKQERERCAAEAEAMSQKVGDGLIASTLWQFAVHLRTQITEPQARPEP